VIVVECAHAYVCATTNSSLLLSQWTQEECIKCNSCSYVWALLALAAVHVIEPTGCWPGGCSCCQKAQRTATQSARCALSEQTLATSSARTGKLRIYCEPRAVIIAPARCDPPQTCRPSDRRGGSQENRAPDSAVRLLHRGLEVDNAVGPQRDNTSSHLVHQQFQAQASLVVECQLPPSSTLLTTTTCAQPGRSRHARAWSKIDVLSDQSQFSVSGLRMDGVVRGVPLTGTCVCK
jgi:hypothetical protein